VLVARSVLRADLSRFACALALVRPSARLDRVAMHDNISVIYDANVHNDVLCSNYAQMSHGKAKIYGSRLQRGFLRH